MANKRKTTLGSTLTALQKAEAQVQLLRQKAASERAAHLKNLHAAFGFTSRAELIDALAALDGSGRRAAPGKATTSKAAASTATRKGRVRVTPGMKADIIKAIKAGDSGGAVATRFGVSSQTVQNIKKAAGLVKARQKKAAK
jgi:hypothetical protein